MSKWTGSIGLPEAPVIHLGQCLHETCAGTADENRVDGGALVVGGSDVLKPGRGIAGQTITHKQE